MSKLFPVINFKKWIEDNRHLLKPPVGNKVVWENGDFIAMVVGGPNSRKDFHINQTAEFFYQVEGDITLKVIDEGEHKDIHICAGDIYLLPPNVPHSPRRPANTIGLVIEQKRDVGVKDGLVWHCENCGKELYDDEFTVKNIEQDLKIIFEEFFANEENRTCKNCGTIMAPPK